MRLFFVLSLLLLAGCQPDKERLLQFRDTDENTNSNAFKDDKPLHREIIDEFDVKKGWNF